MVGLAQQLARISMTIDEVKKGINAFLQKAVMKRPAAAGSLSPAGRQEAVAENDDDMGGTGESGESGESDDDDRSDTGSTGGTGDSKSYTDDTGDATDSDMPELQQVPPRSPRTAHFYYNRRMSTGHLYICHVGNARVSIRSGAPEIQPYGQSM